MTAAAVLIKFRHFIWSSHPSPSLGAILNYWVFPSLYTSVGRTYIMGMLMQENINLAKYTTFKIGGAARFFCIVKTEEDIEKAVRFAEENKLLILILGGGSNILVPDTGFPGVVLKMEIMGRRIVEDSEEYMRIEVGAGENWDDFVEWSVKNGLYGLENLSFIPGTVGASPIQNIGAYGAEVSASVMSVRAYDIKKKRFILISNEDCKFSYRESLFKNHRGRYIVIAVEFKLQKKGKFNTEYKDLKEYLEAKALKQKFELSLSEIRNAIIEIRRKKLPDWKHWGTAGSFFKNPLVSERKYLSLKKKYPDLPAHIEKDGKYKISLAWILDKVCSIKGFQKGNVGTYENQALVIVTRPGATSSEVLDFAMAIMNRVKEETGLTIEGEVVWSV